MSLYKFNADRLQGRDIEDTAPSDGQVLRWNDSESRWEPTSGEADANKIQGRDVQDAAPADGDIFEWNDAESQWEPSSALSDHISDTSNPHSVTASQVGAPTQAEFDDHSSRHESGGSDEINVGGLSGVLADRQDADKLQGNDVLDGTLTDGDILQWNDSESQWEPTDADFPTQSEFDDHSSRHEAGGADQINVDFLQGRLNDPQDADSLHGNDISNEAPEDGDALVWDDGANEYQLKEVVQPGYTRIARDPDSESPHSFSFGTDWTLVDPTTAHFVGLNADQTQVGVIELQADGWWWIAAHLTVKASSDMEVAFRIPLNSAYAPHASVSILGGVSGDVHTPVSLYAVAHVSGTEDIKVEANQKDGSGDMDIIYYDLSVVRIAL